MLVLPSLRKNILRAFLRFVFLFALLAVILCIGLLLIGRIPSSIINNNYASVSLGHRMASNLEAMYLPTEYTGKANEEMEKQFVTLVKDARQLVSEPGEVDILDKIQQNWQQFLKLKHEPNKTSIGAENAIRLELRANIEKFLAINEAGITKGLSRADKLRKIFLWCAFVSIVLLTAWAILAADKVAMRLSHPLYLAAEAFKRMPQVGTVLRLPEPGSLEMRILFDALSRLWRKAGDLNAVRINTLLEENVRLLFALEHTADAILVVDADDIIIYVNKAFADFLSEDFEELKGEVWDDVSSIKDNYFSLRDALQAANPLEEARPQVTLRIGIDKVVYKIECRTFYNANNENVGQMFLLNKTEAVQGSHATHATHTTHTTQTSPATHGNG